jgi:hypothetical protein
MVVICTTQHRHRKDQQCVLGTLKVPADMRESAGRICL